MTDAQEDALARLRRRHQRDRGAVRTLGTDAQGRLHVMIPGDEPARRRQRAITPSGIVERVSAR